MFYIMNNIVLIISFIFLSASCQETKKIYLASYTKDCQGVGAQKCMLIKESPEASWQFFYDSIEGFEYEEGYAYQIEVAIKKIENPLADASSLQYKLVKILSKEKKQPRAQNNLESPNIIDVEYQAVSRGYFLNTKINKSLITLFKDRSLENMVSKSCSQNDWSYLLSAIKKIDIQTINKLKAPSKKRSFDGAPHGQLKISTTNKTYTSVSFDHGNPPKEIKLLVNHILSLVESIE